MTVKCTVASCGVHVETAYLRRVSLGITYQESITKHGHSVRAQTVAVQWFGGYPQLHSAHTAINPLVCYSYTIGIHAAESAIPKL